MTEYEELPDHTTEIKAVINDMASSLALAGIHLTWGACKKKCSFTQHCNARMIRTRFDDARRYAITLWFVGSTVKSEATVVVHAASGFSQRRTSAYPDITASLYYGTPFYDDDAPIPGLHQIAASITETARLVLIARAALTPDIIARLRSVGVVEQH